MVMMMMTGIGNFLERNQLLSSFAMRACVWCSVRRVVVAVVIYFNFY